MNHLGVYFGPSQITLVEVRGKKIVASCQIPLGRISGPAFGEEKIPEEVKLVALFKDELRKSKISAQEAVIGISGKDLIIRTFDLPRIPREEETSAINFEVRKYIPFRIEDLISDFQLDFDRVMRKNFVLFIGIKKDVLDKYVSIFNQLEIRLNSIEYSAFSILRLIKSFGFRGAGIAGIVNIDLNASDEANFMVLKNGFPLFSRDIILAGEADTGALLDKLKAELRVSLDFYHRKFVSKNIEQIYYLCPAEYRSELEGFTKEINYSSKFIDTRKYMDKTIPFSLSLLKAYGSSLDKAVRGGIRIDLLAARERLAYAKEGEVAPKKLLLRQLAGLRPKPYIIAVAALLCISAVAFGIYKKIPIQKEMQNIIDARISVPSVSKDATYEELLGMGEKYKEKIQALDNAVNNQPFVTEILNGLPKILPEGVYLRDFSFRVGENKKASLTIRGIAYLADNEKEMLAINTFFSSLKNDPAINKYFSQKNIISIQQEADEKITLTKFEIACQKQ